MLTRKRYTALMFFVVAFAADASLHLIDQKDFIGYSRFNLFLLPMLIASACYAVETLAGRWRLAAGLMLALVVAADLYPRFWFCPFHLDGSRVAQWGDDYGGFDTTDHSYPYREAIRWLDEKHPRARIFFTCNKWYEYHVEFYGRKGLRYNLPAPKSRKRHEADLVSQALTVAKDEGFDLVVFHLIGLSPPDVSSDNMSGYVQTKVFKNQAHALVIYELKDKPVQPAALPTEPGDWPMAD
jgi:hypothetical protein